MGRHAATSGVRGRRESGAAAIEFAIVFPLVILILFGIVDFGLAFFNQIQITSVAREGARAAVVLPGPATGPIIQRATNAAPGITSLSVVVAPACPSPPVAGSTAKVVVTQNHQWILLGPLLGFSRPLHATAVMQCGG